MKLDWKDVSSYSRSDTKRDPNTVELKVGFLRICVHRHIHYAPDQWLASSEPLFIRRELKSKDLEEAKAEAVKLFLKMYEDVEKAVAKMRAAK